MQEQALKALKQYFGYSSFRPLQWEIIQDVLNGKDTLVLMPTGGGKSLCYQIPALVSEGTAIVVSPLIALMKDQVEGLIANGVEAAFLNSSQTEKQQQVVVDSLFSGQLKLLYVSPEKLLSEFFLPLLSNVKISMIAIDEAHCISSWGHDFRPEYAMLGKLRKQFEGVPFIALTATADKLTRKDIVDQLNLQSPEVYIASFDRPNLSLTVLPGKKRLEVIAKFLMRQQGQAGIIYCLSRKSTEDVATKLAAKGYNAVAYHAGLSAKKRAEVQEQFIKDEVQVICATIAFGMGIDKSNVRFVIHYNLPKNIEGYYQEIGRAGRDGLPSDTLLFYSYADVVQLKQFIEQSGQREFQEAKLRRMQDYTEARICRRRVLLAYFGEELEKDCGNCDVCKNPPKVFDGTVLAQKALSAIARVKESEPVGVIIEILKGSTRGELYQKGYQNLKTFGKGSDLSFKDWQQYMLQLLNLGCFDVAYEDGNKLRITTLGRSVLFEGKQVDLVQLQELKEAEIKKTKIIKEELSFEEELFQLLREKRKQLAREEGKPPYLIFSDATLKELAIQKPTNPSLMINISGVGEHKQKIYGELFCTVILEYVQKNKKEKGNTYQQTLQLIKEGFSVSQIAEIRKLNPTTVSSHIAHLFELGKIDKVEDFVPSVQLKTLVKYFDDHGIPEKLKIAFDFFDGEIDYGSIRISAAYYTSRK